MLLLPSWLPALGWELLVQPDGVMYRAGPDWPWVTHTIMGPFGVVRLLGLRSVPFTYLAITASLAGLGREFEDAARVHGAARAATLRLIWPMLAPAVWSALAIGFAESISDYGVAATLAYSSNFSLATYQLFAAIGNFPRASCSPRPWACCWSRPSPSRSRSRHARCGPVLPDAVRADRPTRVQLCASHTGEHHVTGTVADVAFRGRGYDHAIDIPGHGRLTSAAAGLRHRPPQRAWSRCQPGPSLASTAIFVTATAPGDPTKLDA